MFNDSSINEEKIKSILNDEYTFMENCAEKLFPQEVIFPEERIAGQKVVRYYRECKLTLETEKLPSFQMAGFFPPPQPNHNIFSIQVKNYGKSSQGIIAVIQGSSVNNKNIKIKKAFFSIGKATEQIECSAYETKEVNENTILIFRFNDAVFPAGYVKEIIERLYKTNNMTLYQKLIELEFEKSIKLNFEYELINNTGSLEIFVYPIENPDGFAVFPLSLGQEQNINKEINKCGL